VDFVKSPSNEPYIRISLKVLAQDLGDLKRFNFNGIEMNMGHTWNPFRHN